jgi:hypothetical protein
MVSRNKRGGGSDHFHLGGSKQINLGDFVLDLLVCRVSLILLLQLVSDVQRPENLVALQAESETESRRQVTLPEQSLKDDTLTCVVLECNRQPELL